jgi:hypothetical protein
MGTSKGSDRFGFMQFVHIECFGQWFCVASEVNGLPSQSIIGVKRERSSEGHTIDLQMLA